MFNTDTGGIGGPRVPPTLCAVNGPFDFSEDEIWDLLREWPLESIFCQFKPPTGVGVSK